MKQIFHSSDLIGKTIKGVFDEGYRELLITFTDDTFTVVINDGYDGDNQIELSHTVFETRPMRNNYSDLYQYGMISKFVYDELYDFFTKMKNDEDQEAFLNARREEIHKLQQLAQKYPEIATLK